MRIQKQRMLLFCLAGCILLLAIYRVFTGNSYSCEKTGMTANLERENGVERQDVLKNIWEVCSSGIEKAALEAESEDMEDITDEKDDCSSYAKLGEKITISDLDLSRYKWEFLFDITEYSKVAYSYESDEYHLSQNQAMNLCAELLIAEDPRTEAELEWVMAYSEEGYVGYQMNYREYGTEDVRHVSVYKIGTRGDTIYGKDVFKIYIYETLSDIFENGEFERRFPTSAIFYFLLEDKIIIFDD